MHLANIDFEPTLKAKFILLFQVQFVADCFRKRNRATQKKATSKSASQCRQELVLPENAFTGTDQNLYALCILRMQQVSYEAVSWNVEPNWTTKGCFGRGSRPNKTTTTKQV